MEKDYSLLRPFDLEAAKRGEAICLYYGGETMIIVEYIAGPDACGRICVKYPCGDFYIYSPDQYKMAPLTWVEGKPVYKGDVLYDTDGTKIVAEDCSHNGAMIACCGSKWGVDLLTWTKLKVKSEGWIAVHSANKNHPFLAYASHVYASKEEAEKYTSGRAFIHIEWEEPA